MDIDWWTLALQAVNFLVLVWLLQRFLYKPVMRIVERRRQATDKALAEAEEARRKAEAEAAGYREKTAALSGEREKMLHEARTEIEQDRQRMVEHARKEAEQVIEAARQALARERAEALDALRRESTDLAVTLARTLLSEASHGKLAEVFLERLDAQIAAMSDAERQQLRAPAGADGAIEVATAPALAAGRREHWRRRLTERLGRSGEISFTTDKTLIAGARIAFPSAILEASWAAALEQAKQRMLANEHAA